MNDIPKTIKVEEFCDFLNDDKAWEDLYFDDYSEEYYDRHLSFDGKVYTPIKPGEDLEVESLEADIGWQGSGEAPPGVLPQSLVLFFMEWREKRDFVYVTYRISRAKATEVLRHFSTLPPGVDAHEVVLKG